LLGALLPKLGIFTFVIWTNLGESKFPWPMPTRTIASRSRQTETCFTNRRLLWCTYLLWGDWSCAHLSKSLFFYPVL